MIDGRLRRVRESLHLSLLVLGHAAKSELNHEKVRVKSSRQQRNRIFRAVLDKGVSICGVLGRRQLNKGIQITHGIADSSRLHRQ